MKQARPRKGERLRCRISLHGKMNAKERAALVSWLRRAAHLVAHDADYSEIRHFRLFY